MDEQMKLAEILLAEDSPADIELVRYVFHDSKIANDIHIISNGTEALDRLLCRNGYSNKEIPDLLFLDLGLPGLDGMEILKVFFRETRPHLPIVLLTGDDVQLQQIASAGFPSLYTLPKPITPSGLIAVIKDIRSLCWGILVQAPFSKPIEE